MCCAACSDAGNKPGGHLANVCGQALHGYKYPVSFPGWGPTGYLIVAGSASFKTGRPIRWRCTKCGSTENSYALKVQPSWAFASWMMAGTWESILSTSSNMLLLVVPRLLAFWICFITS